MPYYRITIHLANGKTMRGVRQLPVLNPDTAHRVVWEKVRSLFKEHQVRRLDVVMVGKNDPEVIRFRKKTGL